MKRNKTHRLQLCFDHRNWTLEQWKSVLWSNEFIRLEEVIISADGHVWVWQLHRELLLPECMVPTRKFGADGMRVFLVLQCGTTSGCSWHNELKGILYNSG